MQSILSDNWWNYEVELSFDLQELKLYTKQQNFTLVQIVGICRRQNKFEWKV